MKTYPLLFLPLVVSTTTAARSILPLPEVAMTTDRMCQSSSNFIVYYPVIFSHRHKCLDHTEHKANAYVTHLLEMYLLTKIHNYA